MTPEEVNTLITKTRELCEIIDRQNTFISQHLEYNHVQSLVSSLIQTRAQLTEARKQRPHDIEILGMQQRVAHDLEILMPYMEALGTELNKQLNTKVNAMKPFKFIPTGTDKLSAQSD